MTGVHVMMDIRVFESKESTEPYFDEQAIVKKDNNNYFYRFSGLEMLMNEKYLVMVNEKQRHITCTRRDEKSEAELADPISANLDSLLNFFGTPEFIGIEQDVEHYTLTRKEGLIVGIELYINTVSNTLKRLDYQYDEGQFAIINFTLFDRKPVFKSEEFKEQKYFTEAKGVLKLSDNYSRFRLTTE